MDDVAVARFLSLPFESAFLFIAVNMLRSFGLTFGFVAFAWGLGQAVVTRAAISIALSLPIMLLAVPDFRDLRAETPQIEIPLLLIKEFAVGYGLGLLAALPFLALQYAGAVTDSYRGDNNNGIPDPVGGQLPAFGLLFMLIGLYAFFASGGLWQLTAGLYHSYELWPVSSALPNFAPNAWRIFADLVDGLMRDALLIAAPLLAILIATDFMLAVASRLSAKFQIYQNVFTAKNLVAVLSLPLMALYIERVSNGRIVQAFDALPILQGILR
ncbi:flagellar biosynthetic protein FliR [Sulfitobacter sp. 20_GPM-1509m]|uniref:flagellar biosynthetic protein FliR n=1 Tax=Sulfitobacter sp. 20_GPM-1509m TaxID=1380367 RepID=UPI00048EAA66|nr:flagellar biosynthetic protein FliR [Sulfitobacter sp. 20_GPM-1509m]